jgi:cytochrome c oxidase assembly protein subunit 15
MPGGEGVGVTGFDWAPTLVVLAIGALLAALPLAWFVVRQRGRRSASERLRALALLALFLTFDLILVGAFTRLSDSGLGCPDWPGCYGHASPIGARADIAAAEAAVPDGAVTHAKAWIEMAHRYMATAVGAVIAVLAVWVLVAARRRAIATSPWLGVAALVWVVVQGLFGAFTVTLRLYPAIVTLHLLGGLVLLALLAVQVEALRPRAIVAGRAVHGLLVATAVAATAQMALGGWVSTNYAVLACQEFPRCQGGWWPEMAWAEGFGVLRELGRTDDGAGLPFAALTAIHMAHRLGAAIVLPLLLLLAWRLLATGSRDARPWALGLLGIAAWQTASGLANVLLEWPLAAALGHTGGAAALVVVLAVLAMRLRPAAAARLQPDVVKGRLAGHVAPANQGRARQPAAPRDTVPLRDPRAPPSVA